MKLYKCVSCKKQTLCSCFYLDDLEYEDEQGHTQDGMLPFCSIKCFKEFCKKEPDFGDLEISQEHEFQCEQQGLLNRDYVKRLQAEIKRQELWGMEREHFWHNQVEKVCGHKRMFKSIFKWENEPNRWLCLGCSKYFPRKQKLKREWKVKKYD